jgi:acyl-coenzyme A thioesterase PaaI-like protein
VFCWVLQDVNDSPNPALSIEELARLFSQHMPHGRDIGMRLEDLAADGKTRMSLPAQPFLAGDAGASFFFPGVMFSLADSACGLAVFRALGRFVPIATLDMRIDHLAPATMDADLIAVAECYRLTKPVAFACCELLSGPQRRVAAIAVGTFMLSSSSAKAPDITRFAGGRRS